MKKIMIMALSVVVLASASAFGRTKKIIFTNCQNIEGAPVQITLVQKYPAKQNGFAKIKVFYPGSGGIGQELDFKAKISTETIEQAQVSVYSDGARFTGQFSGLVGSKSELKLRATLSLFPNGSDFSCLSQVKELP